MVILHSFLALAAGFIVLLTAEFCLTKILAFFVPSWALPASKPQPAFTFVTFASSFLTAAAGGYVTGWIATANPLIQVLALALVVLLLSAMSALQARGKHPIWFLLAQVAISPLGVLAGGLARLRVLGIL